MGTALRWLAGLAGLAGLIRLLRRRGSAPAPPTEIDPGQDPDDPAAELRRKLAEAREQPAETRAATGEPAADDRSLEERRGEVHDRARETIDSMRGPE